jgi:PAC2 family
MLGTITGFTDAGGSVSQLESNVFANLDATLIVQFHNDELLDYRSRRPAVFFEMDHLEAFEPAVLGVYLVRDEIGQPFLYLNGYEPDFKWEAFADSIEHLIDLFGVSEFVWVHSIPFPAPHTRPIGVTVSGNRSDLIAKYSQWRPSTQIPGTVVHLLEYRLREAGFPTTGFVLLVPHYLAESEYPDVAVKAFELVSASTGLVFPTDALRDEARAFNKKIADKVAENEDLAKMVANLEQGYQSGKGTTFGARMTPQGEDVPNAEEIAAELEDFLASRRLNELDGDSD